MCYPDEIHSAIPPHDWPRSLSELAVLAVVVALAVWIVSSVTEMVWR